MRTPHSYTPTSQYCTRPTPWSTHKQASVYILIDSNRKYVNFRNLLAPAEVEVQACGTIGMARSNLKRGLDFQQPTDILTHVGTNDVDKIAPEAVVNNTLKMAQEAS